MGAYKTQPPAIVLTTTEPDPKKQRDLVDQAVEDYMHQKFETAYDKLSEMVDFTHLLLGEQTPLYLP
jgi:hypothetical protein